jgi:hypothetical protein
MFPSSYILNMYTACTVQGNSKGTVSRDGYLFEGLNISISTTFAHGFQGLPKAFHYPIQLLASYLLL